jgi:hypothetical protein
MGPGADGVWRDDHGIRLVYQSMEFATAWDRWMISFSPMRVNRREREGNLFRLHASGLTEDQAIEAIEHTILQPGHLDTLVHPSVAIGDGRGEPGERGRRMRELFDTGVDAQR